MKQSNMVRRVLVATAAVLAVVLVVGAITVVSALRKPLPAQSGEFRLSGLDSSVEVIRDELGIPQIYADSSHDLFFAQGYVHAQDRFFEMDYRRHLTAGRLSELVGENESALAADQVIRTMGWRRVAEAEWPLLDQSSRQHLQAYADGVNSYISDRSPSELGLEYTVLGFEVEVGDVAPWDPIDSLAWLKAMAWDLLANFDDELGRAAIYGDLAQAYGEETGMDMVEAVFPAYPTARNLPIVTTPDLLAAHEEFLAAEASERPQTPAPDAGIDRGDAASSPEVTPTEALAAVADALGAVPHPLGEGDGIGSNSWVVAGEYTASGAPILANDPHLGISQPGIWYQLGLHCRVVGPDCPYEVSGFTFAGLPAVVIGHNADLAWGFTNLGPDSADLFLERTFPDGTYLRDGEREPLVERHETVKVNGGDDVSLTVRSTVHGPIISDVMTDARQAGDTPLEDPPASGLGGYAVALEWTALTPGRTGDALFAFATATDAEDIAHAATLFEVPSQNIVFATTSGDIGYQAPGKVPVRAAVPGAPVPSDGRWPRPGWDSRYDWTGFVPPEEMPSLLNPAEGFVVTANQMVQAPGVAPFMTLDAAYGYRSQQIRDRITAQIDSGEKFTVGDMNDIQLDVANPFAEMLLPSLTSVYLSDPFIREAQDLFTDWDRRNTPDSAAAAYFSAVWSNLLKLTFWDQVPESERPSGGGRWLEAVRGLLENETSPWWDDRATLNVVETRDEILTRALVDARNQLTVLLGKNPNGWEWGQLHQAAPEHAVLGGEGVPGVVRALVNPSPIPVGGGSAIVDANGWDAADWDDDFPTFGVTTVPSMRMVVDMSDLDAATWVNLTGNSGHPFSDNYDDQFSAWAEGSTFDWAWSRAAVEASGDRTMTLLPPGAE
ncbi:penicillin acylase family protein [Pseudactinotalea sp. HY160]|uniref:penicillin acylase family protein n=1 Tax=Pseudactinotalea sp. HY160 TaxID=2654490 RepID=UPI00351AD424